MNLSKAFLLDLVLVAGIIFGTVYLADAPPLLTVAFFTFWPVGVYLDLRSTRKIYQMDPENFSENELNRVIAGLVNRFGFLCGSVLYIFLLEIPVFIFISLFLLRFVAPYFSPAGGVALQAGAAAMGMGCVHLTAWYLNRDYLMSRE